MTKEDMGTQVYNYMGNLPNKADLGITSDGGSDQLEKNLSGMNTYFQIISGGANAGVAMGSRYLFETNARCVPGKYDANGNYNRMVHMGSTDPLYGTIKSKSRLNAIGVTADDLSILNDIGCNNIDEVSYQVMDASNSPLPVYTCPRSIYVETTQGGGPAGGLLGSAGINIQNINPLKIANSAFAGSFPDCGFVNLRTRTCAGTGTMCDDTTSAKALLFKNDITAIDKCFYKDYKNPSKPNDMCSPADMAAMGICDASVPGSVACISSSNTPSPPPPDCSACKDGFQNMTIKLPKSHIGKAYYIGLSVLTLYILFKILYKKP